ncbi:MAG: copper oxidase [Cyanobium sp. NAT70]|nr:copper oxidase [Cyanobium sp. NAT70]|tara:strand:- start:866 stop:5458 length:4593 start_codon:yes stop_codon:yes gene_type:complete
MTSEMNYVIGSLFPRKQDGITPNIAFSSSLKQSGSGANITIENKSGKKNKNLLETDLNITSDPVTIPGVNKFITDWFRPQITAKSLSSNDAGTDGSTTESDQVDSSSIFGGVYSKVIKKWTSQARNKSMKSLVMIGYNGPGSENAASDDDIWSSNGTKTDEWYEKIKDLDNYDPAKLWSKYDSTSDLKDTISSDFDIPSLLQHLPEGRQKLAEGVNPDLWYPALLYTYGLEDEGTSYPGPVLMVNPGDQIRLNFSNDIRIGNLSTKQVQDSTVAVNSTYGNSASDGLGGTTSTNYHLHGSHTNPTGFGDNVVSRFTTGQDWTTIIDLPFDHGQGSYWYHPHYHPSVNQQVYGGLSGFLQVGDPLSKVPGFEDIPRNLAVIKMMDLGIDSDTGSLELTGFDNFPLLSNAMTMVTVNGEFQPQAQAGKGGWQSITLSNQANQAFYNISLTNNGKTLPMWIYGEDGHQFPQIRPASGTLSTAAPTKVPAMYKQQDNVVSLAPAKRVDVLVYLPEGTTEITSTYTFKDEIATFKTLNMGGYPDLTTAAQQKGASIGGSAGPLAHFIVNDGVPSLTDEQLQDEIDEANQKISVQKIEPSTKPEDYDTNSVPSVDLFKTNSKGEDRWKPLRTRQFNWAKQVLVGPAEERDIPTQQRISQYNQAAEAYNAANPDKTQQTPFQQYQSTNKLVKSTTFPDLDERWFGYEKPFLINDHVFPNGSITIAQLGTMEEWTLRNWSVNFPYKYIGHPFHIHINDYQTFNSDTELDKKRSLEDVTMLNSSGYKYNDPTKGLQELSPMRGSFHAIDPLPTWSSKSNPLDLATWGANDQKIRMLFQDYIGTYVFHCHILPHEDAGMMEVITVVENTDSSWLMPAEPNKPLSKDGSIELTLAQDYTARTLKLDDTSTDVKRIQAGDLNHDFKQDIILSRPGNENVSGQIEIYDGASALKNKAQLLDSFSPYDSVLAPWTFAEDFSGDGKRDLVTAGFEGATSSTVDLKDLRINAWESTDGAKSWTEQFNFDPFDDINATIQMEKQAMFATKEAAEAAAASFGCSGAHQMGDMWMVCKDMSAATSDGHDHIHPVDDLQASQVSVAMADMNLDNFQDIAISYAIKDGLRVLILDGAALSLKYQTGKMNGGYFPDDHVLADALIIDNSLKDLSEVVLTAGFSSYAQSALEDLVITTQSPSGSQVFTTQLQAGHFIATSELNQTDGDHSGHAHHGAMPEQDDRVHNMRDNSMPLYIAEDQTYRSAATAATPVISGVFGTGAIVLGDKLVIAQGVESKDGEFHYGNRSSSPRLENTSQELFFNLPQLSLANKNDLSGVRNSDLTSTFSGKQGRARVNLTNLTYQAYTGSTMGPSDLADYAAVILGAGQTPQDLVDDLLDNPDSAAAIDASYGAPLNDLSVKDIVTGATKNLYGRDPSKRELSDWQGEVGDGLDKTLLPLSILQSTKDNDIYRTGVMSAAAKWNQAQWSTNANLKGAFGQGLASDVDRFTTITESLDNVGVLNSWADAQDELNQYTKEALKTLIGTEISKSGFF